MTPKQAKQFNFMRTALIMIAKGYMTPDQIRRNHERNRGMGPSYLEELEMAYENIQETAKRAAKGTKTIKMPELKATKLIENQ